MSISQIFKAGKPSKSKTLANSLGLLGVRRAVALDSDGPGFKWLPPRIVTDLCIHPVGLEWEQPQSSRSCRSSKSRPGVHTVVGERPQLTPRPRPITCITEDGPVRPRFPCWSQSDLALSPTSCPGLLALLGQAHGHTQSCIDSWTSSHSYITSNCYFFNPSFISLTMVLLF